MLCVSRSWIVSTLLLEVSNVQILVISAVQIQWCRKAEYIYSNTVFKYNIEVPVLYLSVFI